MRGNAVSTSVLLEFGFRQDAMRSDWMTSEDGGAGASFQSISAVSNNFVLTWNAWSGLVYQIQYATALEAVWQNLGQPITATNGSCHIRTRSRWIRGFYRIAVLR